jgi:hypothetical protein
MSLPYVRVRAPKFIRLLEQAGPVPRINAVTYGPIVVTHPERETPTVLRHEHIHVHQWYEVTAAALVLAAPLALTLPWWGSILLAVGVSLPGVGAYALLSGAFYLWNKLHFKAFKSYRRNPFEVEAYLHDKDKDYKRRPFAWARLRNSGRAV